MGCTGRDFYQALQSFKARRHRKFTHSHRSGFLIFDIYMSTRDIARFGRLLLKEGEWEGAQLIPEEWVGRITSVVTPREEIRPDGYRESPFGFGYQWWAWDDVDPDGPFAGAYTYLGQYGP